MSESQSRYGIMEELNKRKIAEKEVLAELERKTDDTVYETDKQIELAKKAIEQKEGNYQRVHKDWRRNKELELQMLTSDFKRKEEKLETEMKERDDNYEGDFQEWKENSERNLTKSKDNLARFKKERESKIKEKMEVIAEIENGINSLKEMSSEQKATEKGE